MAYFQTQMEKISKITHIDIDHVLNSPSVKQAVGGGFLQEERDFIDKVVCGRDFTFISTKKGHLYSCGNNLYGQLGLGDLRTKYRNHFTRIQLPSQEKVTNISCGAFHTIVLTENHHIYVMVCVSIHSLLTTLTGVEHFWSAWFRRQRNGDEDCKWKLHCTRKG